MSDIGKSRVLLVAPEVGLLAEAPFIRVFLEAIVGTSMVLSIDSPLYSFPEYRSVTVGLLVDEWSTGDSYWVNIMDDDSGLEEFSGIVYAEDRDAALVQAAHCWIERERELLTAV